jgi:hypothetical protein
VLVVIPMLLAVGFLFARSINYPLDREDFQIMLYGLGVSVFLYAYPSEDR